jgi:tetratricopeptide (TPR) repeat protein
MSRKRRRILFTCLSLALIGLGLYLLSPFALAAYHERRAEQALQLQRYAKALDEYTQALRYNGRSARLHLLAGRTARQAGNVEAARQHLDQCRELQQGVSEELQIEEYLLRAQSGEVNQVRRFLFPYLEEEGPLTPLVLEGLTRAYMSSYQVGMSWQLLNRWLELQPNNAEALFRRGLWYFQRQNTKKAIASYEESLAIDPERIPVRISLAEVLRAEKKPEQAADHYREVLRQAPNESAAAIGLAQCYIDMSKPDKARELLVALPEKDKDNVDALWLLGTLEMQDGRPDRAEPLLRRAFDLEPHHHQAGYNLLLCLNRQRKTKEVATMKERLRLVENDQKRLIAITTEEMNAAPANPALHCELGEIYFRFKMPQRGVHWLFSALRIDPHYRRAHEGLRDYYDSLGAEGKEKADRHRKELVGASKN